MAEKWQPGNLAGNLYEMGMQAALDIRRGETPRAIELGRKIIESAAKGGWLRYQVEGHILLSLAYQKAGRPGEAYLEARQALELAEPEGYVRLFVDKGAPIQPVLEGVRREIEKQAHRPGTLLAYIDRLLAALSPGASKQPAPLQTQITGGLPEPEVELPTPLSKREQQVLRLLAGGLSNDDIAANLFLSTNTVKTHLKRIFEKLDVNSRLEAVNKARSAKII